MRCGNPKRTIAKIDKIELDIDSYGKNIDTSIGVIRIDQKYYFLVKPAIQNYWLIQNEPFPYIKMILRKSKRTFSSFTLKRTIVRVKRIGKNH